MWVAAPLAQIEQPAETIAFANGHVKTLTWAQVRGSDFRLFKRKKPVQAFVP